MDSGRYCYRLNGELAPVEEQFSISSGDDGRQTISSVRRAGDIEISVSAESAGGLVEQCAVEWRSATIGPVEASFECVDGGIAWRCTAAQRATEGFLEPDVDALIIYPLMRVFTGPVISAVAADGGSAAVMVPAIDNLEEQSLLLPVISSRQVSYEDKEYLSGFEHIESRRWSFVGGQYDQSAKFWLGEDGLLQRYCWRQSSTQSWEVSLQR